MKETAPTNPVGEPVPEAQTLPQDDATVEYEPPSQRIGWKKGVVIVLLVVGVWTFVEVRRKTGFDIPWGKDLPAAMKEAQNPPKAIVLLVHKRNCPSMAELDKSVFNLEPVYLWATGGIPCRLVWEDHPEVVAKYGITESPTLLVLNPKGEAVKVWTEGQITDQIRKYFLRYVVGEKDEGTYRKKSDGTERPQDKK
jgi:hypothetical protein